MRQELVMNLSPHKAYLTTDLYTHLRHDPTNQEPKKSPIPSSANSLTPYQPYRAPSTEAAGHSGKSIGHFHREAKPSTFMAAGLFAKQSASHSIQPQSVPGVRSETKPSTFSAINSFSAHRVHHAPSKFLVHHPPVS